MADYVTIQNGDEVKINGNMFTEAGKDHVYCSPSWAARDGTPYSVARIMQFLPPQNASAPLTDAQKASGGFTRVRLAWYYRPSDVSDRPTADPRLLLAAIYSETCEISQLRAKCYVAHRDKISDLAGWKKRPDHFYFTRLFDPYIKKEFEVLQTSAVRNIPEHVREVLSERYEYIVAEKEIVPNLTDTLHICDTCGDWCPQAQTIQCDRCSRSWHMSCLTPPLSVKPSRGYGWTCADCARQHAQEVDAQNNIRHTTPTGSNGNGKPRSAIKSNAPSARARGRPRKDRSQAEKEENMDIKTFRMWPFRYFGLHTVAEDTLDEDDFIFPRTVTRVGPKYQASVPSAPGFGIGYPGQQERGSNDSVEVLSAVHSMSPKDVEEFEKAKKNLTVRDDYRWNVDWFTEAVRRLSEAYLTRHDFGTVSMKATHRLLKWKTSETPYIDREWTEEEKNSFEDAIEKHGAELRAVRLEMRTRSHPEVVRFYGHWKNGKLREENRRKREGTFVTQIDVPISDDESSVVSTVGSKNPPSCGACRTRQSEVWYKAPKGLSTGMLCDNCGFTWRRYADLNVRPTREDSQNGNQKAGKSTDKREGTPLVSNVAKRAKTQASASTSSAPASSRSTPVTVQPQPPPPPVVVPPIVVPSGPQLQCVACGKKGPIGQVLRCQQCKLQIHAGACGANVSKDDIDTWTCELCHNEKAEEASLTTDCLLCPRRRRDRRHKDIVLPPPDSFLRACKPTEGQGWAHVLCSVFHPETSFTDDSSLKLIEGISTIPAQKWSKECVLCKERGGAVISCFECPREYHVSCAWRAGYRIGFELMPIKSRNRDTMRAVIFNGDTGSLAPIIYCKHHDSEHAPRSLMSLCEVDSVTGQTALQVYCRKYKRAQTDHTYGLLRKARRLDEILSAVAKSSPQQSVTPSESKDDISCSTCHTHYSPFFHAQIGGTWLCHKCHFSHEGGRKVSITSA